VSAADRRAEFLGIPVDLLDMDGTVRAVERLTDAGTPAAHLGVNAANLVMATDDDAYRSDLAAADLVTADGQSVVWGARLYGIEVPERVTGIDLMQALLDAALRRGWSIYLLGARREVVGALAARLAAEGVRVAGWRDGYFRMDQADEVAATVRESGATILFVGMPSPRKERFIIHHARAAGIPFSVGVGGSFDVLAGEIRRAPQLMQRLGLEWLFRLVQEPRRLFTRYAVTNTRFLVLLVRGAAGRRRRRDSGR
jgi:N-acetylglucosaminyldiphosphoundecaprenol N-acetyl-beta-D-mannosaminyltransferase